jgi:hypothetical protein
MIAFAGQVLTVGGPTADRAPPGPYARGEGSGAYSPKKLRMLGGLNRWPTHENPARVPWEAGVREPSRSM